MMRHRSDPVEYLPINMGEENLREFDGGPVEQAESVKLYKLCRVCADPSKHMVSIFSEMGEQLKLKENMQQHLLILVQKDDVLPLQLCMNCALKLDAFHKMFVECAEANKKLCSSFLKTVATYGYVSPANFMFNRDREAANDAEPSVSNKETTNTSEQSISEDLNFPEMSEDIPSDNDNDSEDPDAFAAPRKKRGRKSKKVVVKVAESPKAPRNKPVFPSLPCPLCSATIKGQIALNQHCLKEHNKYRCSVCELLFDNEKAKVEHKSTAHKLVCWSCGLTASSDTALTDHFRDKHPNEKPFKCETCDRCFVTRPQMKSHALIHSDARLFECETCGKGFKTSSTLRQHVMIHLPPAEKNSKLCNFCGKAFRNESKLRYHMRCHTGEKPFKCENCEKAFHTITNLKLHQLVHTSERKFACKMCNATYRHQRNLDKHVSIKHAGTWNFKCARCTITFDSEAEVRTHYEENHAADDIKRTVETETFLKQSNFQCADCNKYFINKHRLSAHIKVVHGPKFVQKKPSDRIQLEYIQRNTSSEGKHFMCEECGKSLSSRISLTVHKRTHMTVRPFVCELCKKGFILNSFLVEHMRTHTGETPFECNMCGKKFHKQRNLNFHKKRVHYNLRPHICKWCSKAFKSHSALYVHNRIHTGERPYSCDICERTFTQKPDLDRHYARHTFDDINSAASQGRRPRANPKPKTVDINSTVNLPGPSARIHKIDTRPKNLIYMEDTGHMNMSHPSAKTYVFCEDGTLQSKDEVQYYFLDHHHHHPSHPHHQ